MSDRLRRLGWIACWLAFAPPAIAQTPNTEPEPGLDEKATSTSEPELRLSQLLDEADLARQEIGGLEDRIDGLTPRGPERDQALQDLEQTVEVRFADPDWQRPEGLSTLELRIHIREAEELQAQTQDLKRKVTRDITGLEAVRTELQELTRTWQERGDAIRAETDLAPKLAAQAIERVDAVLRPLETVEARTDQILEPLLAQRKALANLEGRIDQVLELHRQAEEAARSATFDRNAPPLWRMFQGEPSKVSWTEINRRIRHAFDQEFMPRYGPRAQAHGLLLLVLMFWACIVAFRRRVLGLGLVFDPTSDLGRFADRPVSAAVTFVGILGIFLYPDAPPEVTYVYGLLLLYPIVRLGTRLTDPPLDRVMLAFAGFVVLERAYLLIAELPVARLLLLALSVLLMIGLGVLLNSPSLSRPALRDELLKYVVWLAPILMLMNGASIVFNVLGYQRFAGYLTGGSLRSVYLTVALGAFVKIVLMLAALFMESRYAQALRSTRMHGPKVLAEIRVWTRRLAFLVLVVVLLGVFDLREPVFEGVGSALRYEIPLGVLKVRLMDLTAFVLALWASVELSRLIRFLLDEEVLPSLPLARGVPNAISRGSSYVILAVGFLTAIAAAGIDVTQLTVLFGALGVGVGFGLQNLVNNFVSGLILLFERPIQVGDLVEFQDRMGYVTSIGIRASIVRTFSGAEVIVPNGELVSQQVINWNLSDRRRRVELPIFIPAENDSEPAIQIILDVARAHPQVIDEPEPKVVSKGFESGTQWLELWCWTADTEVTISTKSDLALELARMFRERGIEMALPRRQIRWEGGTSVSAPPPPEAPPA